MTFLICAWLVAGAQASGPREQAVQLAIEALTKQLGVPANEVRVVNAAPVEWRDSSLGCPERGVMYTPALVPGFKVTLQVADRQYEVHTGSGRAVTCGAAAPAAKAPVAGRVNPPLAAGTKAREHLAAQLGVKVEDVTVKLVRPWRASDGSCDPPKDRKVSGTTYFVELTRGGQSHRYRATPALAWSCTLAP